MNRHLYDLPDYPEPPLVDPDSPQKPRSPGGLRPGDTRFDAPGRRQHRSSAAPEPAPRFVRPDPATSIAPPPQSAARSYLPVWGGLGAVSAIYLGFVVWQQAHSIETALVPVTESLERLASDIADLRQTTALIDARERNTATRVASAETRLDGLAQTASNLPQAQNSSGDPQGQRPTNRAVLAANQPPAAAIDGITVTRQPEPPAAAMKKAAPPVRAAAALPTAPPVQPARPAAVQAPKPVADAWSAGTSAPAASPAPAAVNPVHTGSLAPATSASEPQGLLIASGPSLESIRLSWSVLKQNHTAVLGNLEPRFVPAGDGSAFNLIAGPFPSDTAAQQACATLKTHGVGCKPSEFTGAAL